MVIDYMKNDIFAELEYVLKISKAKKLYKYISFSDNEKLNEQKINTLRDNLGYLSSPLMFNDPYDCELSFNFIDRFEDFLIMSTNRETRRKMKRNDEIKDNIKSNALDLQTQLTKEWGIIRKDMAVCCFSEHLDNFLMWSHYANCYNGICIEYDRYEMCFMNNIYPVTYTEKLIKAQDYMTKENFYPIQKSVLEVAVRAVLSKHSQWKYEKEWRIVDICSNYAKMPIPKKIYIGFKVKDIIRDEIINISNQLGVSKVYITKISSDEYKLIHEPIK